VKAGRKRRRSYPLTPHPLASRPRVNACPTYSNMEAGDFKNIPILDWNEKHTEEFSKELRNVALNVGFMYLKNVDIPQDLLERMNSYSRRLFDLQTEEKMAMRMNQAFLGYNQLGYEITRGKVDNREQFDFGPDTNIEEDALPVYRRIYGKGVWPKESSIPGFHQDTILYIQLLTNISYEFLEVLLQALNLPKDLLNKYSDSLTRQGGSIKIIKYPPVEQLSLKESVAQGCGPHRDPWVTFLRQLDNQLGLQVQSKSGWIDVKPISNTFVVNFGTLLEMVTHGAIIATTHQVLNPIGTERYSMPFFQRIALEAEIEPMPVEQLPKELTTILMKRGTVESDASPAQYPGLNGSTTTWGEAFLANRIRCHPDVGYRHYKDVVGSVLEGFESEHPAAKGIPEP
jgi:isopenicillin N synthase-like dioxygenase